ncbi:MAG: hypothetical protein HeimC2_30880 [Candidatus Heimdallarchaeota archaeon LC_2]|nr:MAG: hypothetical protein HeimC2_30880 [Candidatus Heimdallarchaeota archaeon LC_2]
MKKSLLPILFVMLLSSISVSSSNQPNHLFLENNNIDYSQNAGIQNEFQEVNLEVVEESFDNEIHGDDQINSDKTVSIKTFQSKTPLEVSLKSPSSPIVNAVQVEQTNSVLSEDEIDPYLEFSSELNTTSITTYDETAVSGVQLTLNLTGIGSLNISEVPIDYVLALDGSGSLGETGWNQTIKWAIDFVNSLKPSDRVSIIRFSTGAFNLHSLTDNQSRVFITDLLNQTAYPRGWTHTKDAIQRSLQEFDANSNPSTPKFLFMVTDGNPASNGAPQDPCVFANSLRQRDIRTLIIGVGDSWDPRKIDCLVVDSDNDIILIEDYDVLDFNPEDLSAILQTVANVTATNIFLEMKFNPNIVIESYSAFYYSRIGNNLTWTIDRIKENESWIVTLDISVTGSGLIPVYTNQSKLIYQPVNATTTTETLEVLYLEIITVDIVPPVISVPSDITIEAIGPTGSEASFSASAIDDRDGVLEVTCSPSSNSVFSLGTSIVTCSATDTSDNTGSASFSVTVTDTTSPALTIPADLTVEAESSSGATVIFTASAFDLVDEEIIPTCLPNSGSVFPLGTNVVQCSATDGRGNTVSGSFLVVVVDTIAPTLSSPDDITVLVGLGSYEIIWDVYDYFPHLYGIYQDGLLIDSDRWVNGNPLSINLDSLTEGTYVFRAEVSDTSGNIAIDEVTVTVLSIPEQFACIRDMIMNLGLNKGNTNALLVKLDHAKEDFDNGLNDDSIKHLDTLIKHIEALQNPGKISQVDGSALTVKINLLIINIQLYND